MRALRGVNPWTAGLLLFLAVLFAILGVLQLTRALPEETVVARGSVFGSHYRPPGRYRGQSWEVYIAVVGRGSQIAYGRDLYEAVERAGPLAQLPVTVHMRGALVTQVDLDGRAYRTSAVSSTEAWIEAVVLLGLCLLTLAGLVRTLLRARAARTAPAGGTA